MTKEMNKPCQFTFEEIKKVIQTMYPDMYETGVNYHAYCVECSPILKMTNRLDMLKQVIKEQIG